MESESYLGYGRELEFLMERVTRIELALSAWEVSAVPQISHMMTPASSGSGLAL
jgi:hypothetical protein